MMRTVQEFHAKSQSVKWKIFLYLLGFCVLLLIILWVFQTVLLNDFYKWIKTRQVKQVAAQYTEYVRDGELASLMEAAVKQSDLYVELWSEQSGGIVLSGSNPKPSGLPQQPNHDPSGGGRMQEIYADTLANGGTYLARYFNDGTSPRRKMESIQYSIILEDSDVLLMVSAMISPLDTTVETLRVQLYCIVLIMLVLAILLALLISRQVSRPIERLNNSAKKLGKGMVNFHTTGYREIEELSNTLNQAGEELLKTDRLRQELTANVSHDLRTPLTLITGYGEMMRDIPGENTPENMQVIIDEAMRLTSLVNNMLDLSRLQAGVQEMTFADFDLTQETEKIIGRFQKFCEQEGYHIAFTHDGEAYVRAEAERIAQVIYNFISNAIHHTGDDHRIIVMQAHENGRVKLSVSDTGEGIPEDKLPDIWERYYKLDTVHRRAEVGSGLGLSIVKSILEQHPGVEYGVFSEPGRGSTFWFSLPLIAD